MEIFVITSIISEIVQIYNVCKKNMCYIPLSLLFKLNCRNLHDIIFEFISVKMLKLQWSEMAEMPYTKPIPMDSIFYTLECANLTHFEVPDFLFHWLLGLMTYSLL